MVLQIGEEGTPEELHAEGGILGHVVVRPHGKSSHHAVSGHHVAGHQAEDVDLHTSSQKREDGPLVRVVGIYVLCPRADYVADEVEDRLVKSGEHAGARAGHPPVGSVFGDAEQAKLCSKPDEKCGDGGGEDEARRPAEGRLGHGVEGCLLISLAAQLDRLEGTHVTRHHAKDGNAQAALDEDTDIGLLEEANIAVSAHGRIE